jgi:hypothetical protein
MSHTLCGGQPSRRSALPVVNLKITRPVLARTDEVIE